MNTLYFSTAPVGGTLLYYDQGSRAVATNSRFTNDSGLSQALAITVSTNQTSIPPPPAGQMNYLALQYKANGTYGSIFLPIAGFSVGNANYICSAGVGAIPLTAPCSRFGVLGSYYTTGATQSPPESPASIAYYGAVNYNVAQPMVLFVYPSDICNSLTQQHVTGTFCNDSEGGGLPAATPGLDPNPQNSAPAVFPFRAVILTAPYDNASAPATPTAPVDFSSDNNLTFQSDIPKANCDPVLSTSPGGLPVLYPGDGQIQVDTSKFGITQNSPSQDAPAQSLVVAAAVDPGTPVPPAPGVSLPAGQIGAELFLNSTVQTVKNFVDSTNSNPVSYNVSFYIRDFTGMVVTNTDNSCQATQVHAFQVDGFLNANHCFIATAAFRDGDAAPVMMLRAFRDQILLTNWAGRHFVDLYYRLSPPAAHWLMENPIFRYPVLLLLLPVEIGAWATLHSLIFIFLGTVAFLLLIFAAAHRLSAQREVE